MAKIRADLVGVVVINRQRYRAGDTVPSGARIDEALLAAEKPAEKPAEKKADKN